MQLGKWSPFIDITHATTWYELPPALKAALETYIPDGNELEALSDKSFIVVLKKARHLAAESVAQFPVNYHVLSHFEEVMMNGLDILYAHNESYPRAILQAFAIACMLHDAYHQGSTFRSEAPDDWMYQRHELGVDVTNEWVSALAADRFAEENGFNPLARLFIVVMIWATTFGATAPRGKELGLDRIKPSTFLELAMVVADVSPNDNFMRFMEKNIAVNFDEKPAAPPPNTWSGWIKNRLGFIEYYVIPKMIELDAAAGFNLSERLGWKRSASSFVNYLKEMQEGTRPDLIATCQAMLKGYPVTLSE